MRNPPRIFIGYRRGPSSSSARLVNDRLRAAFGKENVFFDVEKMRVGDEFEEIIKDFLADTDIFVAVIGPDWLTKPGRKGEGRAIDDAMDWPRRELEVAIANNLQLVVVRVDDARAVTPEDVPESIARIGRVHQALLTHDRFEDEFGRVIVDIRAIVARSTQPAASEKPVGPVPPAGAAPVERRPENTSREEPHGAATTWPPPVGPRVQPSFAPRFDPDAVPDFAPKPWEPPPAPGYRSQAQARYAPTPDPGSYYDVNYDPRAPHLQGYGGAAEGQVEAADPYSDEYDYDYDDEFEIPRRRHRLLQLSLLGVGGVVLLLVLWFIARPVLLPGAILL